MIEIIGIAGLILTICIVYISGKNESAPAEEPDIHEDFKAIKRAMPRFHKENITWGSQIEIKVALNEYMKINQAM